ncbi:transposase [Methylomicrobium agile]|uniref:transposase n=1 Tax=Methylomicrobium agile TaxID=39774 RepID=UPI0004DFC097
MKAAQIHGPKNISYDTVPDPAIRDDRDMILKVTATAICGSDLHMYSGGIPQVRPMVMSHEFMGIVEECTAVPGIRGFDAGKGVKGRKRHLLVDILGWLMAVVVTAASVQDRDGARRSVVERTFGWLNHSRRLSKSHERLTRTDETWIYIAMTRLMLNRLV